MDLPTGLIKTEDSFPSPHPSLLWDKRRSNVIHIKDFSSPLGLLLLILNHKGQQVTGDSYPRLINCVYTSKCSFLPTVLVLTNSLYDVQGHYHVGLLGDSEKFYSGSGHLKLGQSITFYIPSVIFLLLHPMILPLYRLYYAKGCGKAKEC